MAVCSQKVSSFLKRAAVVAAGVAAVFAAGGARAATRQFGTVVVNKVNEVVSSFDVGFAATTDETPSTLIMAWGATSSRNCVIPADCRHYDGGYFDMGMGAILTSVWGLF